MLRFFAPGLSGTVVACVLAGAVTAPAMAVASSGAHYRAELATPPVADRLVVRNLVWKCGANGCFAGKSSSRSATVCASLAREAGALRSFAVQGQALDAAELEKCNARAR